MIVMVCEDQVASVANSAIRADGSAGAGRAIDNYRSIVEKIGQLMLVPSIADIADRVRQCHAQGQACIFLSFCLPHELCFDVPCPLVAVFGWPYSSIPNEPWAGNECSDWPTVLSRSAGVITYSSSSAEVIRQAMGPEFNVVVMPALVWDEFVLPADNAEPRNPLRSRQLHCDQLRLDSCTLDYRQEQGRVLSDLFEGKPAGRTALDLGGIVYTAVIDPLSVLENWQDFLTAFCWAFRGNAGVTLMILFKETEPVQGFARVLKELYNLQVFACRVVVIAGPLTRNQYLDLIGASSFIVTSAHAEAQCLPLMEFMSAGVPAIAPDHTAFGDYIDQQSAFVVASSRERVQWPQDPRMVRRTFRYRINWASLRDCFLESYQVAVGDVERYQSMSKVAVERQSRFCSASALRARLGAFAENIEHIECIENRPGMAQRLYRRVKKMLRTTN